VLVLAVPAARTTVAEWLGLRGVEISFVPEAPTPAGTPAGAALRLGRPIGLDEVRARVPFPVLTPSLPELGAPDEVYLDQTVPRGQVALVYRPRPGLPQAATGVGLLLTQFRGDVERPLAQKGVGPGTSLQSVTVSGTTGFWIEGGPHFFMYRDAAGNIREETLRLAGNVLLWERDGVTYRLESSLPRDEALRIAESLR
jgi:hypothetical protein